MPYEQHSRGCLHIGTRGDDVPDFLSLMLANAVACKMVVMVLVLSSPRKRIG